MVKEHGSLQDCAAGFLRPRFKDFQNRLEVFCIISKVSSKRLNNFNNKTSERYTFVVCF